MIDVKSTTVIELIRGLVWDEANESYYRYRLRELLAEKSATTIADLLDDNLKNDDEALLAALGERSKNT